MTAEYFPAVFDVPDMQRAKAIILTEESPREDTETRWAEETPYVMELIREAFPLQPETLVLDYGCGIGRMARAMIDATGCSVIGVDTSLSMRTLAHEYVASERFTAVSPSQFDNLVRAGLQVNAAISVWVLQHCLTPGEDIARLQRGLRADGGVFVLNTLKRVVPAVFDKGQANGHFAWADDGIDIAASLRLAFQVLWARTLDRARTPSMADAGAYCMALRQRTDERHLA